MSDTRIYYTTFSTPLGLIGLAGTRSGLCRIVHNLSSERAIKKSLQETFGAPLSSDPRMFEDVVKQFNRYFSGKLKKFDCKLDLSRGTAFQQRVWHKLTAIPYGKTRGYQWVAKSIKHPQAVRACGSANGKNPLPIIIPCHRVIRSDGGLGGYTGGLHIKRYLLDLESASLGPV